MGSLTWFLPISKNRNLETVAACSGDPSWFDSMMQALGGLSKTPIAHQPKGEFEDSPFLLSPING